jgi:hypothetical protein
MLLSFFLNIVFWLYLFFVMIQNYFSLVDITKASDPSEELECSSCCLNQLKTVNITICATSYQHAMSLIRFIVANSTSLKTLTFDVLDSQELDAPVLSSISQDLLLMKRASPRAEVRFIHWECIGFYLSAPQFYLVSLLYLIFQIRFLSIGCCSSPSLDHS